MALLAGWMTGIPGWADVVAAAHIDRGAIVVRPHPIFGPAASWIVPLGARPAPYSVAMAIPQGDPALPLVVIDPGHGGRDPGATGIDGVAEKQLTLAAARSIRTALLASGRVRVALTRDDDRFVPLQARTARARALGAALFVSLHCDSAGDPKAAGGTLYTLSEIASDKEAARLAARENRADLLSGVDLGTARADVASLLIDLTQRRTMAVSARYADLLVREAAPVLRLHARPRRMAALMVLKAPDMPSVLFELGYVSNAEDARFLGSEDGRRRLAAAVRRATEIFLATR